ncbi:MAG: dihydrofolate reductase [Nanoarchaeota archaeon]
MEITLIAAVAENNVIGSKNDIPWYISEDIGRFKKLTVRGAVIMGRKTYDSILKRNKGPLLGRINIVLSRNKKREFHDVYIAGTIDEALQIADCFRSSIYVIGGQSVYEQTINLQETKRLEITEIKRDYNGDTFFPKIELNIWKQEKREEKEGFDYVSYIKKYN